MSNAVELAETAAFFRLRVVVLRGRAVVLAVNMLSELGLSLLSLLLALCMSGKDRLPVIPWYYKATQALVPIKVFGLKIKFLAGILVIFTQKDGQGRLPAR
ncbi:MULTISPECIES: hypothetical protein [Acetobacter]|jgi:hypothetical protein|uniref:Uncharacterized protein n=1 Tax=Acetobacter lovaniensis TaxID=104100 RepID=A0A841QEB4_9PROT|nr:hypothetical protein [Acetobacter lovaniensis]MBB6456452.1 hypothetical protein [Acetobacter lovaniensis]MCI1698481.1 hypothetical protein [Acetobacter lovaniensis]MCI1794639.1 hypothetical protein [Acetobacter lovaniensis]MCP1238766.1 hypothetical protein [Acetobacter lovaniensis]